MIVSELLQKEAKERILIIDDDEDIRYSIALFLKKHNFKIEVAKDGQDGLEKIAEKFYNLVLLDIKLPDIDGIDLIIPIKEKQPDIEIIMITGNVDINSAINSLNIGVSAYLNKPLNLDELLAHIRNSIEKQHLINDKRKAERALRKSQQVLALKNRISAIFLTISDEKIYGETLSLVLNELKSKYGVFGYIDENGDYICPSMTRDVWEECDVPNKEIIYPRKSWSSGNTIWGRALISGENIYLNNPFKVPKGHIQINRAFAAPINYKDEVIGLIIIGNKKTDYDDNDVKLLESITEYIAPILDARLQRDLEEKQRKQAEHDLGERVKELTSLYNISRLLEDAEISIEQFFTQLLTFIPPAWQFPEITCARITYEEKIFNTENFQEAQWRQIAEFKENGKMVGTVEVIYLEEMPEFDEGPFLKEERNLINAIAEHLSIFIERKRSEKMNNRLAAIVDSSDDAIIGKTLDGIITSWNTGAAKIYGYMAKEVIGKPINILVPPDRPEEVTQILEKIKRRERVDHFETDRITKDGVKISVSLTISPIEDKQGNVLGASAIARNITERKKAEQQIKESEEKFRSIFNNANDAIFIHDLKGQFLEVNDAACKRLGYSKDEFLKLTPKDIDDPKYAKLVPERTQILLQERQTFFETVHISQKEKKIPTELSSKIINFEGKQAVLSIARDITERKKAEKAISDLAKFPSENPNPVLRVTKESVIYTNKKGEILFNAKDGDKIPRLLEEEVYTALDMNTVNKVEIELNNHTYSLLITPIKEEGYANVYGMDITERKKAEKELKESEERYRELYENAPNTYFSIGIDKIIRECNNAAVKLLGYNKEELMNMKFLDLYYNSKDGIDKAKAIFQRFLKGERIHDEELQMKQKNGNPNWISLTVKPVKDQAGQIIESRSMIIDIGERKKAEKAIADLAKFPSENPNPVLRVTKECVIYTNKKGESLFNVKKGDKIPRLLEEEVYTALDMNTVNEVEIELNNHTYSLIITPIKEEGYANVYGMDITERKKSEQKYRNLNNVLEQKVEERTLELAAIYEYAPTMLILLDKERRVQKANRSALEFGRHNEQEIIGLLSGEALRCVNSLNDPRGCGFAQECQTCKFRNSVLDSFKTRKNCIDVEVKLPFIRNGKKEELNLLVSTIPLIIHDESLVLVNINDITSLKTAEQKLKKSEEKVLNLINNISDVLIEVSMDGIITFISPQIYNIVNYESDEIMGQNLINLSHPEEKGMLETRIRSAINSGDLIDINLRILHKKGFYVPISIRGTLVKTDDELKIFAVVSDISERNRVEDMMKREVKQLKEIDQIKTDLINRISHELNTPLVSILSASEILLTIYKDDIKEGPLEYANIIHSGGHRLKDLVDNLLVAFRLESDEIKLDPQEVNIISMVKKAIEDNVYFANKRNIFINIEMHKELYLKIDKNLIHSVLFNVISNAIKNTLPKGNVFVKTFNHPNYVDICVEDTGVGLTKKEMPNLFKKFGKIERYGKGMDVDIEGPGLGLYISKEILKLHNSEIIVESKGRNKGSKFIIRLVKN